MGSKKVDYPSYFGLYFEMQGISFFFHNGLRNEGIFSGGPMYSLCLCIAIALELFVCHNDSPTIMKGQDNYFHIDKQLKYARLKEIILIVTLITTVTTTSYILLAFMVAINYYIRRPRSEIARISKYIGGAIVAFITPYFIYSVYSERAVTHSWAGRIDDLKAGLKAWQVAPIFGNGYNENETLLSFSSYRRSGIGFGFSNSITLILAEGGLILFSVYIIPIISCLIMMLNANEIEFVIFIVVFCIEFFNVICWYIFYVSFHFIFLCNSFEQHKA